MSFSAELKRRNVIKVAAAYIIVGWLIMQAGEVMGPALRLPEWINSALAFFLILGFPVAMVFAWAFEITPEGLKKEKEVDRSKSIAPVTGRKLDFAIIALLLVALGYFAYDKFVLQRQPSAEPEMVATEPAESRGHSIAVLPLADMSPGGDHEYFSDGLTEELLNILAKISELQVAGRTSSFAFKGQNIDLREIGKKLNVDSILEGSVRKDEQRNRVRITLQLIKVEDGYHLWSETYDRDLDDIFAIQEEVAHEVARVLRITLLGEDEARLGQIATTEVDVYDLYLQGLRELNLAGYVNLDQAVDLFQQVLTRDPDYLPAKLGLVDAWGSLASTGAMTTSDAFARGMPLLEQILAAQPDHSSAWRTLGTYQAYGENDAAAATQSFQRALELDPRNGEALKSYGRFLYNHGEVARGMELIDAAVAIDPYNISLLFDQCQTNAHLGNRDVALAICGRIKEIAPEGVQGHYGEALAYAYQGDLARAIPVFTQAIERDPEDFEMLAGMSLYWSALGDVRQSEAWMKRAEALGAGQPIPMVARIRLLVLREQYDRAGELAAHALAASLDDRHGSNFVFRRENAVHALRKGDWQRGLAPYREHYPGVFEDELVFPENAQDSIDDLIIVATLMQAADPLADRPDELLNFAEQHVEDYHPAWGRHIVPQRRAAISALRGDRQSAVEQLQTARQLGAMMWFRADVLENPVFAALEGDDGYRKIQADFEAEAERQRIEAHELLGLKP